MLSTTQKHARAPPFAAIRAEDVDECANRAIECAPGASQTFSMRCVLREPQAKRWMLPDSCSTAKMVPAPSQTMEDTRKAAPSSRCTTSAQASPASPHIWFVFRLGTPYTESPAE
eukprot:CAMPEP_0195026380 /NCGR_PEP_ID=MMETSP0326_2-20130528/50132_1 /TAXON_ID=2866 ORGANISM="Crypthecodinium cohnii, Strain Seligo" /NCGR_SAMPLE_ID=MMETSP0326_2 /ASSEMBLY_ACC=CAM_ASM_000348 /LENGTH=114 /DNA_ID=CAMNT_0040048195 /DNA_START=111 /DNA_END=455 /DNA_ORIENTATION=+